MANKKNKQEQSKLEAFIKLKLYGIGIILSMFLSCLILYGVWQWLNSLTFLTVGIIIFVVSFISMNIACFKDYYEKDSSAIGIEIGSILFAVACSLVFMIPVGVDNLEGYYGKCEYTLSDKFTWNMDCIGEEPGVNVEVEEKINGITPSEHETLLRIANGK